MIKVALSQFDIKTGDMDANLHAVTEHIQMAARWNADLVVLPELWNCSYDLPNLPQLAQTINGSSISALKKLARKHQIFIFAGSIAEKKDKVFYNTSAVIDRQGNLVGKYRKIHLFHLGLEEDRYFTAGEDWGLVETPWGPAGIILCYDLRFPELTRNLVLRGARFIVIPAQWPTARVDHWITLCQARAVENQVFILAANRTGADKHISYPGRSLIISPWGEILKEGSAQKELVCAELDLTEIDHARKLLPVLSDRRGILDEIDHSQF